MATEQDIKHQVGNFHVLRERRAYTVCEHKGTHSVTVQSFARDEDGLSLAIAYADYKARRRVDAKPAIV
jgi:hypothetical protein